MKHSVYLIGTHTTYPTLKVVLDKVYILIPCKPSLNGYEKRAYEIPAPKM